MNEVYVPDTWLTRVGFSVGNPFSTREAAFEPESVLLNYFIPPAGFEEVLGKATEPRSAFLSAGRGHGKTTARRAIEWTCRAGRAGGRVLVVPYLEFSRLAERLAAGERVTARQHVEAILQQAVPGLLAWLAVNPTRLADFTPGFRTRLIQYIHYFTLLKTDAGLDAWLREVNLLSRSVHAHALRQRSPTAPFPKLLADILTLPGETWRPDDMGYIDLLANFVALASLVGCQAVYVLIDRLDETEPLASQPERVADLLEPLVGDLHLMELPRLALKIFITPEVEAALKVRPAVRVDRLLFRRITWETDHLVDMLDRRVEAFSQGKIPSLDVVCGSDLNGLVRQMASLADGSPRNMLRLGEWLLHWRHRRAGESGDLILTAIDFRQAVDSYQAERRSPTQIPAPPPTPTGLRIDAASNVWRDDQDLGALPPLQHRLLKFLYDHPGILCSKDLLIEAVYGDTSATDEMLDKLVQRLRKSVEVDARHPQFVISIPGQGYVFKGGKKSP